MYSRTRDASTSVAYTRQEGSWNQTTGKWNVATPTSTTSLVKQDQTISDVVTPKFKRRSAEGEVINNPVRIVKSSAVLSVADLRLWNTGSPTSGFRNTGWGSGLNNPGANGAEALISVASDGISNAIAQALTAARAKVDPPEATGLVTLAEARETLGFMLSPLKKMADILQRHRRYLELLAQDEERYRERVRQWGNLPRAKKRRRPYPKRFVRIFRVGKFKAVDVASSYLAVRYGLNPLMYEVTSYREAYNFAWLKNRAERQTARATVEDAWTGSNSWSSTWNYGLREDGYQQWSVHRVCRGGVLYEFDAHPTAGDTARRYGITLDEVIPAIWEAIPLSFVADWAINMEDWLRNLFADVRGKVLSQWVTVKTTISYNATVAVGAANNFQQVGANPTFVRTVSFTQRHPQGPGPYPHPVVRIDMNQYRIADAVALVHTLILDPELRHLADRASGKR